MVILNYITKGRIGKNKRFHTMEKLLLFVNKQLQISAGVPYCVIENNKVVVTYEYFALVYKEHRKLIIRNVEAYLSGKAMEKEDYYIRSIK